MWTVEQYLEKTLFPSPAVPDAMYSTSTFQFFMRVLTEMYEAQQTVKNFDKLSKADGFNAFDEKNLEKLTEVHVKVNELKVDMREFIDSCKDTVFRLQIAARGQQDTSELERRALFCDFLFMRMFYTFESVHGVGPKDERGRKKNLDDKEHQDTSKTGRTGNEAQDKPSDEGGEEADNLLTLFKSLKVDEEQKDTPPTVHDIYTMVTRHTFQPGMSGEEADDLLTLFNSLKIAFKAITQQRDSIELPSGNPYIVKFV